MRIPISLAVLLVGPLALAEPAPPRPMVNATGKDGSVASAGSVVADGVHRADQRSTPAPSPLRTVGWATLSATLVLCAAGAVFGLTAQARAAAVNRLQSTTDPSGRPPPYDAPTESRDGSLRAEGTAFNTAALSLIGVAGATALTTAILLAVDAARAGSDGRRGGASHLTLAPTVEPGGARLLLSLTFD